MIYLLHFELPIGDLSNVHGQAQHYLGYAEDVGARLAEHAAGRGAAITAYLVDQGIRWRLVRLWLGDRALERRLKKRHDAPRLCPICNPGSWSTRGASYGFTWRPGHHVELPISIEFGPAPVPSPAPATCPF